MFKFKQYKIRHKLCLSLNNIRYDISYVLSLNNIRYDITYVKFKQYMIDKT